LNFKKLPIGAAGTHGAHSQFYVFELILILWSIARNG